MSEKNINQLLQENEELRLRLQEAEETISAIHRGEVDALVVQGPKGEQVYTLSGQEQIYRLLVQNMHEAGIMTSPQGQILYCNNRFSEMLRLPIEEIIGKPIEDFVHKESQKNIWSLIVGAQVKPMRKRIVFAASDGSLVPARISANMFMQDEFVNICLVAADLTEIEATEETISQINEQQNALRDKHAKLELSAEAGGIGTWEYDLISQELTGNDRCRKMFLIPSKEKLDHFKFMDLIHPEDREFVTKSLSQCTVDRKQHDIEFRVVLPNNNNNIHWFYARGLGFYDDNGNCLRVSGVLMDITLRKNSQIELAQSQEALKESHQKYQHLVEGSNSVILLIGCDLKIKFINKYGLKFFGYNEEEIIGKNVVGTIVPFKDLQGNDMRQMVENLLCNPDEYASNVHQNMKKDGSYVWMAWTNKAIYENGQLTEILAFGNDISKLKETEESLRITQKELERSNKDLEQFAYIASHDLREPLRAITGFIELLRQRYSPKLDGKGLEYIQSALDGSKKLNELLTGLLHYSRVNINSNATLPVPVESALKNAIANSIKTIHETNAQITYDQLPTVKVNGVQLVQLFLNLIGNAMKFRNSANPKIHIGCEKSGAFWQFSVKDNGTGIDKNDFERIFKVFQRMDTEDKYPGHGIGLSICKKIVERSGGKIWVESERGKGSTFYFTLPESN